MKRIFAFLVIGTMVIGSMAGCGKSNGGESAGTKNLEGSCSDILAKVYETAELDDGFRDSLQYFDNSVIPEDDDETEAYMIGTNDVDYTDSVYSAPMMSAIAYQCVLLRLEEGEDVEAAKQTLLDSADPRKWVCVEPESVQVENVGDVVMVIMADKEPADALVKAFKALGE